jgi:hypothetical protein
VYFNVIDVRRIRTLVRKLVRFAVRRDREGLYGTLPPSGFRRVSFYKQQARLQKVHFNEELEEILDQRRDFPRDLEVVVARISPTGINTARAALAFRSVKARHESRMFLPLVRERGRWYVSWRTGTARKLSRALGREPDPRERRRTPQDHHWRD